MTLPQCVVPSGLPPLVFFANRTVSSGVQRGTMPWDNAARTLDLDDPMLERAHAHRPYDVADDAAARNDLPDGLMRPILAVPVGDRLRCLGVALYGPHATGNALSHDERSMLAELADKAASVFMQINDDELRRRISTLERELATAAAELAVIGPRASTPFKAAIETDG